MNLDSYTTARLFATGSLICAASGLLVWHWYGWQAATGWALLATLAAFGARYDQGLVRREKARRRAYNAWQQQYQQDDENARYQIAQLLIAEDHRRISSAEASGWTQRP